MSTDSNSGYYIIGKCLKVHVNINSLYLQDTIFNKFFKVNFNLQPVLHAKILFENFKQ